MEHKDADCVEFTLLSFTGRAQERRHEDGERTCLHYVRNNMTWGEGPSSKLPGVDFLDVKFDRMKDPG